MLGSSALRELAMVGNGWTAELLEQADIQSLSDVWALDLDDDSLIHRLISAARTLASDTTRIVHWDNVLMRAYNRIVLIHAVDRVEFYVPFKFRCSISHQWPDQPAVSPAGHLYDRCWIERWVRASATDPFTRDPLDVSQLCPVSPEFASEIAEERRNHAIGIVPTRVCGIDEEVDDDI